LSTVFDASPVTPALAEALAAKLEEAYALAAAGGRREAALLFGELRRFGEDPSVAPTVDRIQARFMSEMAKERDRFRAHIAERQPSKTATRIVICADSLGLPRPDEPLDQIEGRPTSYAYAMTESFAALAAAGKLAIGVEAWCQRYATSDTVVGWLDGIDLKDAHLLVHVGLNDFSRRIFDERQRLSLQILPDALRANLLCFAQANMYRRDIIEAFRDYCYVPRERWRQNIGRIVDVARAKGARSINWLTIVQLPDEKIATTPRYRANVLAYNLALYEARDNGRIRLIDIDRAAWENAFPSFLRDDLMHLSPAGHRWVANRLVELVLGVKGYTVGEVRPAPSPAAPSPVAPSSAAPPAPASAPAAAAPAAPSA
jgi:lysophospholipase L1-like esterase